MHKGWRSSPSRTSILDTVYRPKFFQTRSFGNWTCFRHRVAKLGSLNH